jgi:hypothetical protein
MHGRDGSEVNTRVLAVLAFGLALLGCGSVRELGARSAGTLVTAEDAQRILGVPARLANEWRGESESSPGAWERRCEYVGPDRATLMVVIVTTRSRDDAQRIYEESRGQAGSFARVEEVSGAGEEGFLTRMPSSQSLTVRKATSVFLLEARATREGGASVEELKRTAVRVADGL